MIAITLPDGSRREFPGPVTVADVAQSIGAGLAWAPLLWLPTQQTDWPASIAQAFFGLVMVVVLTLEIGRASCRERV